MLSDEEGAVGDLGEAAERRRSLGADGEPPEDDVRLPPEPTGRCSNELQEKINRLYEKMQTTGLDMNRVIQQRKDFRNPSIYEKLIQFCSINELGTNYPAHLYDPLRWGKESYYEELAKVQKTEMDRREKEKKDKTKVEFVSGTAKRPGSGSGAEDEAKKRKSKWDQVGTVGVSSTMTGSQGGNILKPAGLLQQPSLTTSATGTKGTVISAFGSLPKKPRTPRGHLEGLNDIFLAIWCQLTHRGPSAIHTTPAPHRHRTIRTLDSLVEDQELSTPGYR
uniref:(California timema) hypothetical protein n=1 Tax=Timema californicum TaxID=61474 RepID=A0A7R9P3G3_TIMCA|nr:unnamed protein product [Timema californicum]